MTDPPDASSGTPTFTADVNLNTIDVTATSDDDDPVPATTDDTIDYDVLKARIQAIGKWEQICGVGA